MSEKEIVQLNSAVKKIQLEIEKLRLKIQETELENLKIKLKMLYVQKEKLVEKFLEYGTNEVITEYIKKLEKQTDIHISENQSKGKKNI